MPPLESVNNQFQFNNEPQLNSQVQQSESGVFMGHEVSVAKDPMSLLQDAAEEMGFMLDVGDDLALEDRKEKEEITKNTEKLLKLFEMMQKRVNQSQKMELMVEQIRRSSDPKQIMQAINQALTGLNGGQSGADPTDQWVALQYALSKLNDDPTVSQTLKSQVQGLADEMMKKDGKTIRLGIHGQLAGENYPELGSTEQNRDLYRQTVGEFSSTKEVFKNIQQKFGNDFHKAMDFLFAALSADIDSELPSMGKEHLESVHGKLEMVRLTQNAFIQCDRVMQRWKDVHQVSNSSMNSMDLLEGLIDLKDRNFIGAFDIDPLVQKASPPDIEHEVLFTQDLLGAVKEMPVDFFDQSNARETVIDAIQSSLDASINREDEYLASLE